MKKHIYVYLILYCIGVSSLYSQKNVQVIFDTDMGPDYDDIGAIAMLHALADNGECDLLACVASDAHPLVAPTIDLYNQYYNRGYIPVAKAVESAPNFLATNNWNEKLLEQFPQFYDKKKTYLPATELYRKLLSEAEDKSITIVTVGFLSNLEFLLKSSADKYSQLSGIELVKAKVKKMVSMAGIFPSGSEFNVNKHPEAAKYVFDNWPTTILFSGFEIGKDIRTGESLFESDDPTCPVAWGYRYNGNTYKNTIFKTRQSWDQTAVLAAIRNSSEYFYVVGPGAFQTDEKGYNEWNPLNKEKQHYFLVHKYPFKDIVKVIDELMEYKPK